MNATLTQSPLYLFLTSAHKLSVTGVYFYHTSYKLVVHLKIAKRDIIYSLKQETDSAHMSVIKSR